MTKKIKLKWVEVPVFSLGGNLTIFSFQYVPKNNRNKKIIKRAIKRGLKNGTKVLLTENKN